MTTLSTTERKEQMRKMRAEGKKLQQIADFHGITRQRVHQILGNTGRIQKGA